MPWNDNPELRENLNPWRVILTCLLDKLDSYDIPAIIDKSGMEVNWMLTDREDYSDKYRKHAYRPRIVQAYNALTNDDRLRVCLIVTKELALGGFNEQLNADLARIGWQIENDRLSPANQQVRELFFPPDTQHDAYVEIRKIARDARHSLRIIDPYLDETIFNLFYHVEDSLKIGLPTSKLPYDLIHEVENFRKQYPQIDIEVRCAKDFHDRFIVIDDEKCWHIGCSIKDAGNKAFFLSRLEDPKNIHSLLNTLNDVWTNADVP